MLMRLHSSNRRGTNGYFKDHNNSVLSRMTGGMEMFSLHFDKQVFINSLKANKNLVTYMSTTFALMLTLMLHGLIQGDLKLEYFAYALIVSVAFFLWAVIDSRYRKQHCEFLD